MNTQELISNYLNIDVNSIKKITELHYVFCVVVEGQRPVFVSKKKLDDMEPQVYYTIEDGESVLPLRRIGYTSKENAIQEFNDYESDKHELLLVEHIQLPTYLHVKVILEKY
jgi:hypothetical protein